ncbi:MAG: tetratricopeptide repeat protein, partial [Gemmatimonadetes bacterium]|nr:tetratricopeptide repeat protein [Gemmatimonadota bacterium]
LRLLQDAHAILPGAPSIRRTLAGTLNLRGAGLARRDETAAAVRNYVRAMEVDPTVPESYINLARLYLASGGAETALEITAAGLEQKPDHARLLAVRAETLIRTRQFAEARGAAERALVIEPRTLEAHAALADALQRLGDNDGARAALEEGLRLYPDATELTTRIRKLTPGS